MNKRLVPEYDCGVCVCTYTHIHIYSMPHDFKHYVWPPPLKAFITGKGNSTSVPWPTGEERKRKKAPEHLHVIYEDFKPDSSTPALKPDIHFKALPSPNLTSKIRYAVKHCSPLSSLLLQLFTMCKTQFTTTSTHMKCLYSTI